MPIHPHQITYQSTHLFLFSPSPRSAGAEHSPSDRVHPALSCRRRHVRNGGAPPHRPSSSIRTFRERNGKVRGEEQEHQSVRAQEAAHTRDDHGRRFERGGGGRRKGAAMWDRCGGGGGGGRGSERYSAVRPCPCRCGMRYRRCGAASPVRAPTKRGDWHAGARRGGYGCARYRYRRSCNHRYDGGSICRPITAATYCPSDHTQ